MTVAIDFSGLAAQLLASAESYVREWLPAGRRRGNEYVVGSVRGDEGDSLSINLNSGVWMDFATGEKGGDLISLYAAIHGLTQAQAARALGGVNGHDHAPPSAAKRKPTVIDAPLQRPPEDAEPPGPHRKHGPHTMLHAYRDAEGLLMYVARYDLPDGSKQFSPWRWTSTGWQAKAAPKPRPLYGLDALAQRPHDRVMLVEGEKCADALRPVLRRHVVMTWPGGASAVDTVDWAPLAGRKVDIWPDNDTPGRAAMAKVAEKLIKLGCQDIRLIDPTGQSEGWDAADAVAAGMDAKAIARWIKRNGGRHITSVRLQAAGSGLHATDATPSSTPHLASGSPPITPDPATPALSIFHNEDAPASFDPRLDRLLAHRMDGRWHQIGIPQDFIVNNRAIANEDTVHRFCEYFDGVFWFDTFLSRPMTTWMTGVARPIDTATLQALTVWLQRNLALTKISPNTIKAGIGAYTSLHRRNCAQEWLHSLKWDGNERLKLVLPAAFGTDDDEYHAAVGRCFFVGMARRVLEPGCQMDNVMLLEGGEGNGKSSILRIIGGDWYTEAIEPITSKDFYLCLQGRILVELSEMSSFERASVEKVKAVITNRVDTFRSPYDMLPADYPRQCVFTCSTNRDDWNKSDTGARRFWRVRTGKIDLEWMRANREQCFAEAVARVLRNEPHWDVPQDVATALNEDARITDPWTERVLNYAMQRSFVRPEEMLGNQLLELTTDKQDDRAVSRVRSILRRAGFVSTVKWENGRSIRVWRPSRISAADEPVEQKYRGKMSAPVIPDADLDFDPEVEL
jgi:predicted P-loop ATPase